MSDFLITPTNKTVTTSLTYNLKSKEGMKIIKIAKTVKTSKRQEENGSRQELAGSIQRKVVFLAKEQKIRGIYMYIYVVKQIFFMLIRTSSTPLSCWRENYTTTEIISMHIYSIFSTLRWWLNAGLGNREEKLRLRLNVFETAKTVCFSAVCLNKYF